MTDMNHYGTSLIVLAASTASILLFKLPKEEGRYKHTHSIVLLAKYSFTLLNIGDYGSHSDGGVVRNSAFGKALERVQLQLPTPKPIA